MDGAVEDVEQAARQAATIADELRRLAHQTERLSDVGWISTGADRWRDELSDTVESIRRDAHNADEVAAELRAHAAACEQTLDTIRSVRDTFLRSLDEARAVLARAADEVSDAAVAGAQAVVDQARRLPPPNSPDWLGF